MEQLVFEYFIFEKLSREFKFYENLVIMTVLYVKRGPLMVAQWLRYCATNPKVAGSFPDGVIGIFH
jgi:hypothetical protein